MSPYYFKKVEFTDGALFITIVDADGVETIYTPSADEIMLLYRLRPFVQSQLDKA